MMNPGTLGGQMWRWISPLRRGRVVGVCAGLVHRS